MKHFNLIIKYFFVIIVYSYSNTAQSQNDLEKYNLKGNVKSIDVIHYTVYDENGEYKKVNRCGLDSIDYKDYNVNFNFKGSITSYEMKNRHKSSVRAVTYYKYNELDSVSEIILNNTRGETVHKMIREFDERGYLKKSYSYWGDENFEGESNYTTNPAGKITKIQLFSSDGFQYSEFIMEYDKNNNLIV